MILHIKSSAFALDFIMTIVLIFSVFRSQQMVEAINFPYGFSRCKQRGVLPFLIGAFTYDIIAHEQPMPLEEFRPHLHRLVELLVNDAMIEE